MAITSCEAPPEPVLGELAPLPRGADAVGSAARRVDGRIGTLQPSAPVQTSNGSPPGTEGSGSSPGESLGGVFGNGTASSGDISLDFEDTDIRDVAAQILGNILRVNYTVDPAVHGTATLRTVRPLTQAQLLPTLQSLLAQSGAALVRSGTLYRVVPAAAAGATIAAGGTGTDATTGGTLVPLQYASAEDLAKVLQPFVANGGKIIAASGRNALLIDGEPATREVLLTLVRAFDTNVLAGQSYALLPVSTGSVKDFASALQDALRAQSGGALAGLVRVVHGQRERRARSVRLQLCGVQTPAV